jgi:hypothetical protein
LQASEAPLPLSSMTPCLTECWHLEMLRVCSLSIGEPQVSGR